MKRDLVVPMYKFNTSFLSCEKDAEAIINKLFISSQPYSDILKRLLIINTKDCLSNKTSTVYQQKIKDASLSSLIKDKYICLSPKLKLSEFEEVKSRILITFDNFAPSATNPQFRDCDIIIDIICHTDCWELEDYQSRPLKIAGYIDGLLDNCRLSGIGTLHFAGAGELLLNEDFGGYSLIYNAVHGTDDIIPGEIND